MRRGRVVALAAVFAALVLPAGDASAGQAEVPAPESVIQSAAHRVEAGDLSAATATLLALDGQAIPVHLRRQADLLLGILLTRQGRQEESIARLEAATSHPLLGDYALYHLAVARRRSARRDLAAEALRLLAERHPQSLFVERAGREMVRDLLEAGDLPVAEAGATRYLAAYPNGAGRADVRLALGEVLLRSGRTVQAEEALRRLWVELPGAPESQRAKGLLATIPEARPFTPDEQFQRAATLHALGRYGQAVPELSPFAGADSPRQAQARLLLGTGSFNLRQYGQAVQWLEPLPDSPGADRPEALFWLGRSAGRAGDAAKFAEVLTRLIDTAPQERRSQEALYLLAQTAADEADPVRAQAYLGRLLQEYPKGGWTDVALWLQGWLAYKQRQFPTALNAWGRLLADEPGSRWRVPALYWRGRVFEATKRTAEATQTYRTLLDGATDQFYYRLRAGERLAALSRKPHAKTGPPASRPVPAGAANGLHAQKARALRGLGLTDETVEEWSEQVRSRPEDRAGLAEACGVFQDLRRYEKAIWVAGRILRPLYVQENGQLPIPGFWQCLYPLGYFDLIRQYAAERGLDPYLALALMREESAFAPHAVSRTGARGLMQLMPQTADLTAREHKLPVVAPAALETPEVNIRLGVHHLADLIREFGGNLILTLASYNAGKQPVQRWVQRFGFEDDVEFVEDIPYTETRNYVKRVLGSYERYKSLYEAHRAEKPEPRAAQPARQTP